MKRVLARVSVDGERRKTMGERIDVGKGGKSVIVEDNTDRYERKRKGRRRKVGLETVWKM